ncbi:16S rRNA (cytidine1402-2'-O)-methyltransferase [Muriicola jejuensis]|uniref:SAM-dependent methyltransferase n=1 Tax=Muriicola jejuensis TaxID=504488 RepID=A0A6P0ULC8_9FLAO|nr:SAM-dependent methyltransferase [Muriicola jejuensis]NER11046.1 SAM-dependent methyltransferase [Muriicola jejuensis]SMP23182.1 16S rRNA (cytidine1402-2'-O)-methyltransferase [Muriicola jejuensis]
MSTQETPTGRLYLIPTTLGDTAPLEVLPISIKQAIEEIDHYIVENEKSARHFIKNISPRKSQPALHIEQLNKFTEPELIPSFLEPCLKGFHVGVLSEAGSPAVADPGSEVVRLAHEKNIRVVPLVGPSSLILALMSSGLNGQNFCFHGYLPIENQERKKVLKAMEKESRQKNQTQLFIETPYRNDKLYEDLIKTLAPSTLLCIAAGITLNEEFIRTRTVEEWGKAEPPQLHKKPAIFLLLAQ